MPLLNWCVRPSVCLTRFSMHNLSEAQAHFAYEALACWIASNYNTLADALCHWVYNNPLLQSANVNKSPDNLSNVPRAKRERNTSHVVIECLIHVTQPQPYGV